MKAPKTESEILFEQFCSLNKLPAQSIPTGAQKTPDYLLTLGTAKVYVEVKQIDKDENFRGVGGVSTRTVGEHVRQKITESKKQLQPKARNGEPCLLLIYNKLDANFQMFGTEEHDFISAMYGELTVLVRRGVGSPRISESFHGRNASVREAHNTSFSAVGHLRRTREGASVLLYENVYARNPLDYGALPPCIEFRRIEISAAT